MRLGERRLAATKGRRGEGGSTVISTPPPLDLRLSRTLSGWNRLVLLEFQTPREEHAAGFPSGSEIQNAGHSHPERLERPEPAAGRLTASHTCGEPGRGDKGTSMIILLQFGSHKVEVTGLIEKENDNSML